MSEEQIKEITAYGEALMSRGDIKLVLQLSEKDLETSAFTDAYNAGFLKTKYLVQKSTIDLAANGSSPAQTIAAKLISGIEHNNLIDG